MGRRGWVNVCVLALLTSGLVPGASADVWLRRDGSGALQFTNAPTTANTTLLFREPPPRGRGWPRDAAPTRYDGLIRTIADRYSVDFALVKAVIRAESGFDPRAVSPKGARGLMQLMPATAARHNVRNIFSPRENVGGGVEHLRMLLDRYSGNVRVALAAYNAGSRAVAAAGGRVPPYRETREYIRRVLWYRAAYKRVEAEESLLSRR